MPRSFTLCLALCLPAMVGCGRVVFRPQQPPQTVALSLEQQQQIAQREQELQSRASQLDTDNQELEAMLAQSRQQVQLLNDQIVATQDQLRATVDRLAHTEQSNSQLKQRTEALVASVSQPAGGSMIRPNSTLLQPLRLSGAAGVSVRQDGDVIRVAIAADELFYTSAAQLQPAGERLLQGVVGELTRAYPEHLIGLEGHTDGAPLASAQYPTSHHLSVAQATTAYDVLRRAGLPAAQLFVIGHGANHPLVSNATEAGRQKNRRLELVVYPETVRDR
ncbi:OmpA family protein [Botrimarina hoheduenensis]|uniref:Putative lipoprotein YiaD n=1 Tax=Botrimarina hoheduenensis TaxID=2528000 RepID=A0A5C5WBP2_9BACT|nr:OmpA family protein [Botrimarina hoheduenensis]TWT48318.1 putative lipoprotein YiaD precursor [Botrimarina hoheduenensis]